ncbi:hypothetical protein BHE74_00015116 [Ensete ventricosum]|uniref:Uncharacterized protein n=1 Tax=Ensete ventricosum TaxID=4639 RepID=A0A445MAY8_ENSVE|nr:hypothetical protein BHE74_00015116 [Ensete ventricosum]RZR71396.1 hypothetical protein BHM03_00004910 [Ensete ventricosum]
MFYLQLPYHLLGSSFFFAQRIPLDFLEGDAFREAADNYVRPLLTKFQKRASFNNHVDFVSGFPGLILENAGDLPAAAALADEARSMDLADRYLNTECVMQEENETKTEKGRSSCQESNLARIFYTCRCSSVGMFSSKFLFDILQEAEERNEDTTSGTSKSGKRQNSRPVDLDPHGKKLLQVPSKLSMFV